MSPVLDHILWAAPDLDAGTAAMEGLTGVAPARGGSHPGFGTRNSLLSLGATYLEIIAPDPAQPLAGNRGGAIAAMDGPGLITFAVRTNDLDAFSRAAGAAGGEADPPTPMSRTRPDGATLSWAVMPVQHPFGDMIPFAIDWQGSPHPSGTTPTGCELASFEAMHPQADRLAALYAKLEIDVPVRWAFRPGFVARLRTPRGLLVLTTA